MALLPPKPSAVGRPDDPRVSPSALAAAAAAAAAKAHATSRSAAMPASPEHEWAPRLRILLA